MSLERDLADLEATDPVVGAAAARLDEMTSSILSTSAALRRTEAELGSALSALRRLTEERDALPRLPVTDHEIRQWYAGHHLAMSCGPAVLFAALRKDFNQTTEET